jgi:hypothetical protein
MKNIAQSLVAAQKAFGPALKSSTNPHFKSRYADLSACVEAVIDGLNANGIALIQMTHDCDNGVIVETVFLHESGEQISAGKLHVPAIKQDAQAYGSALTYARRYSLMAACGIAPEDDDGNKATRPEVKKQAWSEGHEALTLRYREAAMGGMEALKEFHAKVPQSDYKTEVWMKHGESLKAAAVAAKVPEFKL